MVLIFANFKRFFINILITLICLMVLLFWINKSNLFNFSTPKTSKIEVMNGSEKYLTSLEMGCMGRLGNQMFQIASLFALGKAFNRTLFSLSNSSCTQTLKTEISRIFAHFPKSFSFLEPQPEETFRSEFSLDCCKYHNHDEFVALSAVFLYTKVYIFSFHDVEEKYLVFNKNYFQSYKYFNSIKKEIRYLFDFDERIKVAVNENDILKNNEKSHKLCIHIRRDDFIDTHQLESRAEFIEPAIKFLHKNLTQNEIKNVSLIFLGQDPDFVKTLKYDRKYFSSINFPKMRFPEEDMYFGISVCDTLLITASGSTFAWWIGYLMPKGSQVFYNSQVSKKRDFSKDYYDFDYFPREWNMLELNKTEGEVYLDNRWYYERFGWPRNGIKFSVAR